MTTETVDEAERMRRVPGIVFTGPPDGRKARIAGHSIDVWYLVGCYKDAGCDRARMPEYLETLTEVEIDAGLRYYALYSAEIEEILERNRRLEAYVAEHGPVFSPPFPPEYLDLIK